ncbi:hypothetical protein INT45_013123 [Circinella minor]|uniref:Uncharacterized protein n=1 Tax=Circinella minor TaxID=1195481 RepID=A0A8H7VPZ2_9FUNG|nr:hypothetical protein INT45_013123 [Circinella minor]
MSNGLDVLGTQNAKSIYHLNNAPYFSTEDRQRFFFQEERQDPEIKVIRIEPGTRAMFTAIGNYNDHQEDLGNKNWRTHNIKTVTCIQSTLRKSKAECKAERHIQVRTIRESLNQLQGAHIQPALRDQRLVIAYGDVDLRGTMKGNGPLPTKTFRRYIARRALVICVDEYNTSTIRSGCHQRLFNIRRNDMSICNHP